MSTDLLSLLPRLSGARILCVGDVMLDRYVYGRITRISPEAPIPVFVTETERLVPGGAGNVARNVTALGGQCDLVTLTGQDATATQIAELLNHEGAALRLLPVVDPARQTPRKTRHIAGSQQVLRTDEETTASPDPATTEALMATALSLLPEAQAVILSDYGKGTLAPVICHALIAAARARNIPLFVDPKGTDYSKYAGAGIVTPNRSELEAASRLPAGTDVEVEDACRALIAAQGFGAVIATRSEKGMSVVTAHLAQHMPTEALAVYDVSGAGDTVVAALALAAAAAGIVVGKRGTATATPAEIRQAVRRQGGLGQDVKILEGDTAGEIVRTWQAEGLKVGFTNGCFDILHAGHVALLAQARKSCDRLVVGLNSDASVRRLKGPTRPVHTEDLRAFVLAALEAVDAVVVFGEDTPLHLITTLRPDVLMKGADYTIDTVVGADVVQAYGGAVKLIPLVPGLSTTGILAHGQHAVATPRTAVAGHA
jgi:D-beta-D-heptose 7-phosphate kinase / D-beta-D-heptose 1-phosphate adenosyltransferase